MKKPVSFKELFRRISGGGILLLLILLSSCENFLEGAKIKEEIDDQIAYSNAPSFTITVDAPKRTGIVKSPAGGQIEKKVTDTFAINFEAGNDWEFIRWKIMDSTSKTELENGEYLSLSSMTDPETECKFVKSPSGNMKLSLVPVMAERPQILSYAPLTSGVYKDSTIQVLFDFDMDKNSIYYNQAEIDALKEEGITEFLSPDSQTSIFEPDPENQRIHGYKNNDGETFFKNITITNKKTKKNINHCFNAPSFDNPNVLSISTKKSESLEVELDSFTQVLVCIEKGFFYSVKIDENTTKIVEMAGSKKWLYQVNGKIDSDKMNIPKESGKDVFTVKLPNGTELSQKSSFSIANKPDLSTVEYARANKLKLNFEVNEANYGSGPSSLFSVNLQKIYNESSGTFTKITSPASPVSYSVEYQNYDSETATFNDDLDMSEWDLSNGVYAMNFTFKDRSNNSLTYPEDNKRYFFTIDRSGPDITPTVSRIENTNRLNIKWESIRDLLQTTIEYKMQSETDYSDPEIFPNTETEKTLVLLTDTTYDLRITYEDLNGNKVVKTFTAKTGNSPMHIRTIAYDYQSVTIAWDPPDYDCDGYEIVYTDYGTGNRLTDFTRTINGRDSTSLTINLNLRNTATTVAGTYGSIREVRIKIKAKNGSWTSSPESYTTYSGFVPYFYPLKQDDKYVFLIRENAFFSNCTWTLYARTGIEPYPKTGSNSQEGDYSYYYTVCNYGSQASASARDFKMKCTFVDPATGISWERWSQGLSWSYVENSGKFVTSLASPMP